ncbi:hypothetical protein CHUAL_008667 [Chamberlinius hualienensis]
MKNQGKNNKSPLEEGISYGICTTTDLDFLCHMSNSRYLRELDFGRVTFVVRNGVFGALKKAGGDLALGAMTIRYRRSVTLFQVFRVKTKVVSWDDRYIYVEQRLETIHDNFTRAIAYFKVVLVNYPSANDLFKELGYPQEKSPVPPPELASWIEFNDLSSKSLQKERGNKAKDISNGLNTDSSTLEANLCTSNSNTELKED